MKNLFSERYKYKKLETLKVNEMPISFRNRLWNVIKSEFFDNPWVDRNKIIEIIWDKFFKEDLDKLEEYWREEYWREEYNY